MTKFWVVLLVLLSVLPAAAFASKGGSDDLFKPAREADIHVPATERNGAQFIEMDRARFEALASWKEFTCLIPNFPLASDGNFDLRVEQFDVVAKDMKGKPAPEHLFLRGSVDGFEDSHLCLTIYNDCAWGYIYAGGRTYSISSAGRTEMGNLILGIIQDTSTATNFTCGVAEFARNVSPKMQDLINSLRTPSVLDHTLATSVPQISVGIEMDSMFVQRAGKTDSSAFKYGLAVLAAASDQYMRDANVSLVCATHYEWTTTDPYPDVNVCDLLYSFDGSILPGAQPMIRVLFSGRLSNQCGGIAAGIDVLCDTTYSKCVCGINNTLTKNGWDFPYHHWTWDLMVAAHEMGHVIACYHTHDCIWNPPLDSCVAAESPDGSPALCYDTPVPSKGTIMSYCHLTPLGAIVRFHPLCSALIASRVATNSCVTSVSVPQMAISPTKTIQECAGGQYHFTCSASGSTGPYGFSVNPAPDSLLVQGDQCTIVLNPAKGQKFYVRLTDVESVRVYDSIMFVPLPSFNVSVKMDSLSAGPDSMVLSALMGDASGVTFNWYKLPNPLHWSIGSKNSLTVTRATAGQYYVRAATSGGCVAQDTVTVTTAPTHNGVVDLSPVTVKIYPNPATQSLTAILPSASVRCWIEDVLGRRMDALTSTQAGVNSQRIDFDLSRLTSGTYWLLWETGGKISVSSFVKS
jgi:hypothetical protein